jgi:hypothetical protein
MSRRGNCYDNAVRRGRVVAQPEFSDITAAIRQSYLRITREGLTDGGLRFRNDCDGMTDPVPIHVVFDDRD